MPHFPSSSSCSLCLRDRHCLSSAPSLGHHKSNAQTQAICCAVSALLVLPPNANKRFPQCRSPSCLSTDSGWTLYSPESFCHYTHKLQHLIWTINGLMFIYLFGFVSFFFFFPSALSKHSKSMIGSSCTQFIYKQIQLLKQNSNTNQPKMVETN